MYIVYQVINYNYCKALSDKPVLRKRTDKFFRRLYCSFARYSSVSEYERTVNYVMIDHLTVLQLYALGKMYCIVNL